MITISDVLRVARDLHLDPSEFADFQTFDDQEIAIFVKQSPGLFFNDGGLEGRRFFVTLRRVESRLGAGTVRCIFLNEWERTEKIAARGDHPGARVIARCGIYASRPLMCRSYPSVLDAAGLVTYLRKPPESRLTATHEFYQVCPEEWTPEMFSDQPDQVAHNHAKDRYEWAFQRLVIEKWNKAPKSRSEFFPLMEKVYQARLVGAGNRWSEVFEEN